MKINPINFIKVLRKQLKLEKGEVIIREEGLGKLPYLYIDYLENDKLIRQYRCDIRDYRIDLFDDYEWEAVDQLSETDMYES
ncbi:hypothetical protein CEW46_32665 [Bacillus cereus]|nr:hypothetical protein CEW46_32665 [Bacillus cereus]